MEGEKKCKGESLLTGMVPWGNYIFCYRKKSLHFRAAVTWPFDVVWSWWFSQLLNLSLYWGCFQKHCRDGRTNTQCFTSSRGSICKHGFAQQAKNLLDYTNTLWYEKDSWLFKNCNKRVFFLPIRAAHSSDKEGTWGEKCPNWAFISFGLLTGPPSFMC